MVFVFPFQSDFGKILTVFGEILVWYLANFYTCFGNFMLLAKFSVIKTSKDLKIIKPYVPDRDVSRRETFYSTISEAFDRESLSMRPSSLISSIDSSESSVESPQVSDSFLQFLYAVILGAKNDHFIKSIRSSGTRLGDFWKFLVTNFITKVAQIFWDFPWYFEVKTAVATFFGGNSASFYSISSHWFALTA